VAGRQPVCGECPRPRIKRQTLPTQCTPRASRASRFGNRYGGRGVFGDRGTINTEEDCLSCTLYLLVHASSAVKRAIMFAVMCFCAMWAVNFPVKGRAAIPAAQGSTALSRCCPH
jgi:hypothetical protein